MRVRVKPVETLRKRKSRVSIQLTSKLRVFNKENASGTLFFHVFTHVRRSHTEWANNPYWNQVFVPLPYQAFSTAVAGLQNVAASPN